MNSAFNTSKKTVNLAEDVYSFLKKTRSEIQEFKETDTSLNFLIGFTTVIVSVPPGSWIFHTLHRISGPIAKIFSSAAVFLFSKLFGQFYINIVNITTSFLAKTMTTTTVAIFSACVTLTIFQILPFIAVSIASVLRFLFYLYEILRTVFCLPFYAVIVATRNAGSALTFFRNLIRLMIIPSLIAVSAVFAFFGIELVYFLLQKVPLSILFSSVVPSSLAGGFMAGIITGIITIFASFVAIAVGWNIAHGFTDKIIEEVSSIVGHSGGHVEKVVSPARSMFSRLTHTAF